MDQSESRRAFASSASEGVARHLLFFALFSVTCQLTWAAGCLRNDVRNSLASSGVNDWVVTPPQSNATGAAVVNSHFQITTTGSEVGSGAKGQFSQTIAIPMKASNVSISAMMKRDKIVREGSPLIQAAIINSRGILSQVLASTALQASGNSPSWANYSASFLLPADASKVIVYLKASPRTASDSPSANVAYFDNICVQFAALAIAINPSPLIVVQPSSVTLTCLIGGTDKAVFSWTDPAGNSPSAHRTITRDSNAASKLTIVQTNSGDEGTYNCTAVATAGIRSAQVYLEVDAKPKFKHFSAPESVRAGEDLTLPCAADGKPFPTVAWHKDGRKIVPNQLKYFLNQISFSLIIKSLNSSEDSGLYTCVVQNRAGTIQKAYSVIVHDKVVPRPSPTVILSTSAAIITTMTTTIGVSSKPTSIWDRKLGPLKVYEWFAIGGSVVVLIFVFAVALCASCHRRKLREKKRREMAVHYTKASRKGATYAVGDRARIVGAGHHPGSGGDFHPDHFFPTSTAPTDPRFSGLYPESGYNSSIGTMERGSISTSSNAYQPGSRYSHLHFPLDNSRLTSPRSSTSSTVGLLSPSFQPPPPSRQHTGYVNEAIYEEINPVKEEQYVEMHPTAEANVPSPIESNLDATNRKSRPSSATSAAATVTSSKEELNKRSSTEIPDTPGDIDYKI